MSVENSRRAFQFPGQNSAGEGMAARLLSEHKPVAGQVFEEVSDATGINVAKLCTNTPQEEIIEPMNAPIAAFTTSIAYLRVLASNGHTPDIVAGHSLGEYSAHVAAGSLTLESTARLVIARSKFIEEKTGGKMVVFNKHTLEEVEAFCNNTEAEIANYNSQKQFVIAGPKEAVDKAISKVPDQRSVVHLPFKVATHCSFSQEAAEKMVEVLKNTPISKPQIAIVANATAEFVNDENEIRALLVDQLTSTVQWLPTIIKLIEAGIREFDEVGAGHIMTKLVGRIVKEDANLPNVKALTSEDLIS